MWSGPFNPSASALLMASVWHGSWHLVEFGSSKVCSLLWCAGLQGRQHREAWVDSSYRSASHKMASAKHGSSGQMNSIKEVMEANTSSKAAGQQLLRELPWTLRMQARLRSIVLLCIIAAAFWVRKELPAQHQHYGRQCYAFFCSHGCQRGPSDIQTAFPC
jgi:hypothetical protein